MTINLPKTQMRLPVRRVIKAVTGKDIKGAGSAVALVAEPIKNTIIQYGPAPLKRWADNCHCSERKEKLDDLIPF